MDTLRRILLVDDSERDTELALNALEAHNLANEVIVLRDGSKRSTISTGAGRMPNATAASRQ